MPSDVDRSPSASALLCLLTLLVAACSGDSGGVTPTLPPPDDPPVSEFLTGTGEWQGTADLPIPLRGFGVAAYRGALFVVAGISQQGVQEVVVDGVYRYDVAARKWDPLNDFPAPVANHGLVVVADTLFAVGGASAGAVALPSLWAYDPDSDAWSTRPPMPEGRHSFAAVSAGGRILVVGGWGSSDERTLAYDVATGSWTREPGPDLRISPDMVEAAGSVYLTGGRKNLGSTLDPNPAGELLARSPSDGSWAQVGLHKRVRDRAATAVLDGRVHFVGGQNTNFVEQTTHVAWDPVADQWYEYPEPRLRRSEAKAVSLGGRLYVIGGIDNTIMYNLMEEFIPQ
jgi:N-acetylneuraminic acid mutarotase